MSIAYRGFPEGRTYVLSHLFEQQRAIAGSVNVTDGPRLRWRDIRSAEKAVAADISLLGCAARRVPAPGPRTLVLPFRVRLQMPVEPDLDATLARIAGDERRQFRKLRRGRDWSLEIGGEVDDLRFFYERIHLPTMASRHGAAARSADWPTARWSLFRRGVLLFVTESGKRVAGALCRIDDGGATLRMRLLGVLDGDASHYRSGAMKAVYYLTVEWAVRHGVRLLDFAGQDPFPAQGIFQFKRRFHPRVTLPSDHYGGRRVVFRCARDSPAVRDLLAATPMIVIDSDDRLTVVRFADHTHPPRPDIRMRAPGIEAERIIDLDEYFDR